VGLLFKQQVKTLYTSWDI